VLDVKVGSGAFMQKEEDARALARQMVAIGSACGRRVTALLTNMDVPLGRCVGNSLEVREAVEILWGRGCEQLREVCVALSAQLVALFRNISPEEARQLVEESLRSGAARETMKRWIAAQGGNAAVVEDLSLLPAASLQHPVSAPRSGWLTAMDARRIGEVSSHLGAGRLTKTSEIDLSAGLELLKKPGDWVEAGETLAILHTNRADALEAAAEELCAALSWGQTQPVPQKLILGVVNETGETRA